MPDAGIKHLSLQVTNQMHACCGNKCFLKKKGISRLLEEIHGPTREQLPKHMLDKPGLPAKPTHAARMLMPSN
jgi:hypothetical protein